MKQKTFYTELSYVIGIILLALGGALTERAGLGLSMVVIPAYISHVLISQTHAFFTFGMAEYTLQAILLIVMMLILRKFRFSYLFAFITAVFFGLTLNFFMLFTTQIPNESLAVRIALYVPGIVITSAGVSLVFHTYISPEVYELFVKEVSAHFHKNINHFKTGFDITCLVISIVLSFVFFGFGNFVGVGVGTVICAFINGFMIGRFSKLFEKLFVFKDLLPLRKYFE